MELIKQLGGYEKAKSQLNDFNESFGYWQDLNQELLEYRRRHNIFEVGDKVVFVDLRCSNDIWYVSESFTSDHVGVIKEGMLGFSVIHKSMIRHTTDAEIKAGHRL